MPPVHGRAVQVTKANGPFAIVDREFPDPGPGHVRIRVQACGVCHSDVLTKAGLIPGIAYPRVPGHEVAGIIDAVADDVKGWVAGQRVGVGWLGGYCGYCEPCRRGKFILCLNQQICGIAYDGGYADYIITPANGLALIPDDLSAVDAGPLMCAGITTFNSLRNSGARPGDLVAVLGIGGLGHLGVQFAARSGYQTVAIARGEDKAALAKQLGAHHYIDSQTQNPAEALAEMGGAQVILATVTDGKAMASVVGGLADDGKLLILGAPAEPLEVSAVPLLMRRKSIAGWPSGSSIDSQDTLDFSVLTGVRPMIETYPLSKAPEAFERMMSGKARFRVVLQTEA
jgi:D-arabinose 1-dehydrogenase-like Zn-dependent alcohol dehydrogenase